MSDWLRRYIPEIKRYWFVPLMILLGIFLIADRAEQPKAVTVSASASENYVEETEHRLIEMLKGIEGAGECRVTITLSSGGKKEYVREDGSVLVITDKDGNQSAVVSRENAPEIAGITVASKGAGSLQVRNNIIESVSTVLGIGTNKICVVLIGG